MKHKRFWQYSGAVMLAVLLFFIGFYCGRDDYRSGLIAVKHIDGKYGKAFYGVEVFGKAAGNRIEVYARVHIGGVDRNYYHDCGKIGIAWNWQDAREKFGGITFDGSVLSIGSTYSIPKEKYENHR
ncbi:MAG: hypothetical protein IKB16_11765 [Lentisphaeria bacterium]|nr:hypothetical protein [Lentisphaeria bacterium]